MRLKSLGANGKFWLEGRKEERPEGASRYEVWAKGDGVENNSKSLTFKDVTNRYQTNPAKKEEESLKSDLVLYTALPATRNWAPLRDQMVKPLSFTICGEV